MKKYKIHITREDQKELNCVIKMPEKYNPNIHTFGFNDKYDDLISDKILDKINMQGMGYLINNIKELK